MAEKRYVIVRADRFCPRDLERNYNLKCIGSLHCDKCDLRKKYGDTKEQMILKVAQEIFKAKLERYRQVWKCECSEMEKRDRYKDSLILARKIVEFLGVE